LNQKVKNLIQKLGEAIHESVSESEDIAGVVKNIREQGFDVLLMLEATIGLNEVEAEADEVTEAADEGIEGPFTSNDVDFLKSLRISLAEDEPTDSTDSTGSPEVQAASHLTRSRPQKPGLVPSALPSTFQSQSLRGRLAFPCNTRVALCI